jgi:hypothetical protein
MLDCIGRAAKTRIQAAQVVRRPGRFPGGFGTIVSVSNNFRLTQIVADGNN